jgi:hypothetical protein
MLAVKLGCRVKIKANKARQMPNKALKALVDQGLILFGRTKGQGWRMRQFILSKF